MIIFWNCAILKLHIKYYIAMLYRQIRTIITLTFAIAIAFLLTSFSCSIMRCLDTSSSISFSKVAMLDLCSRSNILAWSSSRFPCMMISSRVLLWRPFIAMRFLMAYSWSIKYKEEKIKLISTLTFFIRNFQSYQTPSSAGEWFLLSILTGITNEQINRLQRIQNCAARLIAKIRKHKHWASLATYCVSHSI